ncbi:MAG: hypothetical protein ACM3ML_04735 [Micromonosporaceae bacterium]
MSTPVIILIVVVIVLAVIVAALLAMQARRRSLRQRFGPEYDRLAAEHGSRKAEAELAQRQRHVRELDIRPLTPEARARYNAEWAVVQERFVETPQEALKAATGVVTSAMRDRGYPTENYDQMLADLSVEHAHTLSEFRQAHDIGVRADAASTEDLRQAMIRYRTLFQDLVGIDGDGSRSAPAGPNDVRVAGDANADPHARAAAAADQPSPGTAAQDPSLRPGPAPEAAPPQAPRR